MFNHNIWNHAVQVLPHLTQELPDWKQFEITEVPQFIVRTGSISRNGPKPNPSKSDKLSRIPETVSEFPCYLLQSGVYKWKGRWDRWAFMKINWKFDHGNIALFPFWIVVPSIQLTSRKTLKIDKKPANVRQANCYLAFDVSFDLE